MTNEERVFLQGVADLDQAYETAKSWLVEMTDQDPHLVDKLTHITDPDRKGAGVMEMGLKRNKSLCWTIGNFACIGLAEVLKRLYEEADEEKESDDAAQ